MRRSSTQRLSLVAAALFGVAPVCFGLFRAWRTGDDYRMLWMAVVASVFAAGVVAAAIGRRRTRHAVVIQSIAILVIATLLAGCLAYLLGATAAPGIWLVAFVLASSLTVANVLVEFSRPSSR